MPGFPLAQLALAAGNARNAYSVAKRDAEKESRDQGLKQALAMLQMQRQEQQDRLAQALQGLQSRNIESQIAARNAPKPTPRDPVADANAQWQFRTEHPLPSTSATSQPDLAARLQKRIGEIRTANPAISLDKANEQARLEFGQTLPLPPQQAYTFPQVGSPEGPKVARANTKTGEIELTDIEGKAPGAGMGGAAIKTKVGANRALSQTIDAAIASVKGNPKAFGLVRGVPIIGDALNQRVDPGGVGPRADIANIGSAKMHDRSGAAVTAKEFPRLAPFIPAINDTPEAIVTKLERMKSVIDQETTELERAGNVPTGGGRGGGAGTPPPGNPPLSADERTKAASDPKFAAWLRAKGYQVP